MNSRPNATSRTEKNELNARATEDIIGQFYFALGQGSGTMRIQRSAIAALRARYAGPISENVGRWKTGAPNVLAFVMQIGRMAAHLATVAGRAFIAEQDLTMAREAVEASVHSSGDRAQGIFVGPWCPGAPVVAESDETNQEPPDAEESTAPSPGIVATNQTVN